MWSILLNIIICTLSSKIADVNGSKEYGTVIGIDFGTSNCGVGVYVNGRVIIIPNEYGSRTTPSFVSFTKKGERLIGDAALSHLITNAYKTVFNIKRIIGREWADKQLQEDIVNYPFKIVEYKNKSMIIIQHGMDIEEFQPEEIAAMLIGKMKQIAENFLGVKVTHVVLSVPAQFNNNQKRSVIVAANIAGLVVLRLINEPSAVALAYMFDVEIQENERKILVVDLGGGYMDVSIMTAYHRVVNVISTKGTTYLGGFDFDRRVTDYFIQRYLEKKGINIRNNITSIEKLRREIESAKRTLSKAYAAKIEMDSFMDSDDFSEQITRETFEDINNETFKLCLKIVREVLSSANLIKTDISEIILVGGSTRIPKIQELIRSFFENRPTIINLNPDEAIAYGAAIHAGILMDDKLLRNLLLIDICPMTIGVEAKEDGKLKPVFPMLTIIPNTFSEKKEFKVTELYLYEGDNSFVKDNFVIGYFNFTHVNGRINTRYLNITFDIDTNGIIMVSVMVENSIELIENEYLRYRPNEINKMIYQKDEL